MSSVPSLQEHWDVRAAINFIAGGTGSGLLVWLAVVQFLAEDMHLLAAAGAALVAVGLAAVWAEIGRPWRTPFVFRHLARSWMSREAAIAPFLLAFAALSAAYPSRTEALFAGLFAAGFLYTQARMLNAGKGIPAWRHAHCVPLVSATGLAEGLGFVAGAAPVLAPNACIELTCALIAILIVRLLLWDAYLAGLEHRGAPAGALGALRRIDMRFVVLGHLLPAVLALAVALGVPGGALWLSAASLLATGCGWAMKYTLVCRAAYTQGVEIEHPPVRGLGTVGVP